MVRPGTRLALTWLVLMNALLHVVASAAADPDLHIETSASLGVQHVTLTGIIPEAGAIRLHIFVTGRSMHACTHGHSHTHGACMHVHVHHRPGLHPPSFPVWRCNLAAHGCMATPSRCRPPPSLHESLPFQAFSQTFSQTLSQILSQTFSLLSLLRPPLPPVLRRGSDTSCTLLRPLTPSLYCTEDMAVSRCGSPAIVPLIPPSLLSLHSGHRPHLHAAARFLPGGGRITARDDAAGAAPAA